MTTTTNSLSATVQALIGATLIQEVRETATVWPLLDVVQLQRGTLSHGFPRLTTTVSLTAITSGANEADAQSATTLNSSVATATAASKAAHVLQSWLSLFGSVVNWETEVPQILGRAAADLMDVDAAALLGGFSNTTGSTGLDCALSDLRAAALLLRRVAKSMARGALYLLHPQQVDDVDAQLQLGAGPGLSPLLTRTDMVNWYGGAPGSGVLDSYRGNLYGLPVVTSTNVPDANTAADHAGALFVPRYSLGGAVAWLPTIRTAEQDVNLKLASSWQVSTAYGVVEKKDEGGVSIITDHV